MGDNLYDLAEDFYTAAELDAEIAQCKLDISAARRALAYSATSGAMQRSKTAQALNVLESHARKLSQAKKILTDGGKRRTHTIAKVVK